ncbi:MAG TPA: amidohydrolase family protein [Sphingobium sp.]|nr:amidohydrolase family protein [Sphingobium sp.]
MDTGFLITNGTVVDGTGAPPFDADIRVRDGRIAEIGPGLQREGRERIVDARGCYVTPGFIEVHNHFDGPMWWMPTLEPMPGYGVTTSVNGHCGFSAAPVSEDQAARQEMVRIFSFFEDIPEKPFLNQLPWDWTRWSEYRASLERNVQIPINFVAFVGHIAIRLAVMGIEAWDRAATADEIARMCGHLDDALKAGALGLSSNLLDHDAHDRPVPSWRADDAEWSALMDVLERHEGSVLQINFDYLVRFNAAKNIARIARLAKGRKLRMQLTGAVPTVEFAAHIYPQAMADFEQLVADGHDVWNAYSQKGFTIVVNFNSSLMFAQSNNYAWGDVIEAKGDEAKFAMLSDPAWRKRARDTWCETVDQSPLKYPEQMIFFESESGAGPLGITLRAYMDRTGIDHPSDALAEWVLENGPASVLKLAEVPKDDKALAVWMRHPRGIGNVSDSGAHGQMFCGIGDNVMLLTEYVRDTKALKIEEAIHILTGQPARHYNLHDRGILEVGRAADIAVFNLDEIECRPMRKAWDVPNGEGGRTFRWSRDPAPMRLTLVNGVATFDNGDFTGRFPGAYVGPVAEPRSALA